MASAENIGSEEEVNIRSLRHSSIIDEASDVASIEEVSDWRKEIINYLQNGALPSEKKSAVQLKMKAGRFTMVNGMLYKRGFTLPLLKCVSPEEGNYILREIHEGICGNHSGARVLAHKAVRAGFYWPNMSKDSTAIVRIVTSANDSPTSPSNPPKS
jgi:hypothetical protein